MSNKNLKIGKVYDFDGEVGSIVTSEDIYTFTKTDLNNFTPKRGEEVEFVENINRFGSEYIKTAKFIKIHEKESKTS